MLVSPPEVAQLGRVEVRNEDVLGLYVPVDDRRVRRVQIVKRPRDLEQQAQLELEGDLALVAPHEVLEAVLRVELRYDVEAVIVVDGHAEQHDDVRVPEPREDEDLAEDRNLVRPPSASG